MSTLSLPSAALAAVLAVSASAGAPPPGLRVEDGRPLHASPVPERASPLHKCATRSTLTWDVREAPAGAAISQRPASSEVRPSLPFAPPEGLPRTGALAVRRLAEGWLYAHDGDRGPGLWWLDEAGKKALVLVEEPVRAVLPHGKGFVALAGGGKPAAVLLEPGAAGWKAAKRLPLDGVPLAAGATSQGVVIVTTASLSRLAPGGTLAKLGETTAGDYGPRTVVELAPGTVAIGMKHFVVTVDLSGGKPVERWFALLPCGPVGAGDTCPCDTTTSAPVSDL